MLDKYIDCQCGKKKKINWKDKAEFKRGIYTFCLGLSECNKCGIHQQHYAGNIDDISSFLAYVKQNSTV